MRNSRFTEAQVLRILKQAEQGRPVTDLASTPTRRRLLPLAQQVRRDGSLRRQELNRLLDENRRLKSLGADLTLGNQALKFVLGKKEWSPPHVVRTCSGRKASCGSVSGVCVAYLGA